MSMAKLDQQRMRIDALHEKLGSISGAKNQSSQEVAKLEVIDKAHRLVGVLPRRLVGGDQEPESKIRVQ